MARTIKEIKEEMARAWMSDGRVARAYGFEAGTEGFGERFGAASVENVLLYVWACAAWAVEKLMDELRTEVKERVEAETPHHARWYKERALEYIDGAALEGDTCGYSAETMAGDDVAVRRVVRQAAATEDRSTGRLLLKVAGAGADGGLAPLGADELGRFREYMAEIKDAGVRLAIVSKEGDGLTVSVGIEYDPLLKPEEVRAGCESAVMDYVRALPFNGEYTHMGLMSALSAVDGVTVVGPVTARNGERVIVSRDRPSAGYFKVKDMTITLIAYDGDE